MSGRAGHAIALGAMVFSLWPATIAKAVGQQLLDLKCRQRQVVRAITDGHVGRRPQFLCQRRAGRFVATTRELKSSSQRKLSPVASDGKAVDAQEVAGVNLA
jgi:hypothetical protein